MKIIRFLNVLIIFSCWLGAEYHGQVLQDKYMNEKIFNNKPNGVFIDVGAHDGISFSNTLFFEQELGWTGICVEPHPDFFAKLKNNRSCYCYDVCAGKTEGSIKFLKVTGYANMLSGILQNYEPAHIARIDQELQKYGGSKEIVTIPVRTLTSILEENEIYEVDFLSLDVEGSELDVLLGIDFSKFHIKYILVEKNYPQSFKKIVQLLGINNYKIIYSFDFDELFELQES